MLLFALLCCRESDPVLPAIEEPRLLGNITSAEEARTSDKQTAVYQKQPDVYIDVFYLGGRSFTESRGVLAEQLGNLQESSDLPFNHGKQYQFERGTVQVLNDEMYRFQIPLPELERRSKAFQMMGFPEQIDNYVITHKEYRVNNEWEFRRFRLRRDNAQNEFITQFEAWKWVPNER